MLKKLKFYKEDDNRWYAFIPEWEGDKEELEMVCGADILLDLIAQGDSEVTVSFSIDEESRNKLELESIDESGGYYNLKFYNDIEYNLPVWLCNVTKFVFGDFPKIIYF